MQTPGGQYPGAAGQYTPQQYGQNVAPPGQYVPQYSQYQSQTGQPSQGYAPQQGYTQQQQQGYAPQQQQEYTPQQQQQGYPMQEKSYAPQQHGYSMQQQGYTPQQQQGYPPQGGQMQPQLAASLQTPQPGADEDDEGSDPTATAPPLDSMGTLPGYEGVGFTHGGGAPPPPAGLAPPPAEHGSVAVQHPTPSQEEVRELLAAFVSEHCCYSKGPVTDMKIVKISPVPALMYTLQTMAECRLTKWQYVPWRGEPVPPPTGPPPGPWDVVVTLSPDQWWQELNSVAEVPNTQSVRRCHDCLGNCDVRCTRCHGRGYSRCMHCHTAMHHGRRHGAGQCSFCHGRGSRRCLTCHGNGMVKCPTCEAAGNIKCYVELTVQWRTHKDVKVVEHTDLPDQLIETVSGEEVYTAEDPQVAALTWYPDEQIGTGSLELVNKHATAWPTERIYRQKHSVQSVPVHSVSYEYDDNSGTFFLYGNGNKVHFPDYPAKCCCAVM